MPRQDVPYGGAICRLKERIAEIWDELGKKLHSINGVEGDAAGDVKIVSGDAAIVVTSDQVNHQIEVALDSSQLPAASVSSVNGQTGAVVLDGDDIELTAGGVVSVSNAVITNGQRITILQGDLNTEISDRQNADSALQTNINAVQAGIPAAAAAAVAADPTVAQLSSDVAALQTADAGNVKLAGSQTITGIKLAPTEATGNYSQQIANSNKVKNELDNYAPMARLANNQEFLGTNIFDNLIINGIWNNKSTVCTSASGDNTVFKRLYTMSNAGGSQYATIILLITPKRIHKDHAGILMVGNNRNASLTVHWLVKPDAVDLSDFVATREESTNTIWCRSYGTDADGYHAIKLAEHGTSNEAGDRWTKIVNDAGEVITQSGYVDSGGITHTFDRYVEAS